MKTKNIIIKVEADSIAEEMGIEPGDELVDINNQPVKDVFDYRYMIQDEYIELGIRKPNGDEWLLEIDKDEYEDIGIVFETGLMDKARCCSNKCIFCFIDQLPPNMRQSLYFKDDDSRLSFLQGNYVTLTNMKQSDIDRIIFYHLSPINVSVHTTDPQLRKFMLKNPNAVKIMDYLDKLNENHIEMNFQIVLCKGINDGKYLEKSIEDLGRYLPLAKSLAIVPFGKTKYRDGLCQIEMFDKQGAAEVIDTVERWQRYFLEKYGRRFCYVSDEFYITAQRELPHDESYEGYAQLENGVGMMTLLCTELTRALDEVQGDSRERNISIATGKAAFPYITQLMNRVTEKFKGTHIDVHCIVNDFFGETITVSGLMTGQDIVNQLRGKKLGTYLFLPENCLRTEEEALLDDMQISNIEKELDVKVVAAENDGYRLLQQIIDTEG